jgi:competence protein ComEC
VGRVVLWPLLVLQGARGQLFAFVPVALGCGVGLWFSLPWEPGLRFYLGFAVLLAIAVALRARGPELLFPVAVFVGCVAAGVLAAGLRGHLQQAPVLKFRYYGSILGRVIEVDRSQSDTLRITLDRVVLDRVAPDKTPERVRISLTGGTEYLLPEPGQVVMTTGSLTAPPGPAEPGGFDFARMAYFDRLGAVGYTRNPVLLWALPDAGAQWVNRTRTFLSNGIMAQIPGDAGAFASGVMTGDRSQLSQDAVLALRDSSLAHLLAISGMNMAFITAFVFALLRYGIALVPFVALRVNAKKLAAVAAFGVALLYLLLSGTNVATVRAFIMVTVMLGAILLDRRALTLRSVAIAAVILLLMQPEALLEPGFQMSFAATVALISGFNAVDQQVIRERVPRWMNPLFLMVFSSVVAGFATAPFAAAHFNRFTDYGLLANLLTVPVMSVVMAAGVMAALLAPVGLAGVPLWIMGLGAQWILYVAHMVAGWDGAVTPIVEPGPWVLPLVTIGGIWLIAWQGRGRLLGLVCLAMALVLWMGAERPAAIIAADGGVVGVMGPDGRALSAAKGSTFSSKTWLENDGDLADQDMAAGRPGFAGPRRARRFVIGDWRWVVLTGKGAAARVTAACAVADIVVVSVEVADVDGCRVMDLAALQASGPVAVWLDGADLRLEPTLTQSRLWLRGGAEVVVLRRDGPSRKPEGG